MKHNVISLVGLVLFYISIPLNAGIGVGYSSQGTLPVQLTSFSAIQSGNIVSLRWTTATEVNNFGFELQRSATNSWQIIGFVPGHGNSNSPKSYSFEDKSLVPGNLQYRLKQIDTEGKYKYSSTLKITASPPSEYKLVQNFPNPFNPATNIRYSIPDAETHRVRLDNSGDARSAAGQSLQLITLKVYDVLGREVAVLVNEQKSAGSYEVEFNGGKLSSGVYFYQLRAGSFVSTKKFVLLK